MGYQEAMEAAGATILAFERFGSYQGSWWAKVEYEGKQFWIRGGFGSCSGCDAFYAEFGYDEGEHCDEHAYYSDAPNDCKACAETREKYKEKLANFGRSYLTGNEYTQQEAEKSVSNSYDWDEKTEQLKFIKENAIV